MASSGGSILQASIQDENEDMLVKMFRLLEPSTKTEDKNRIFLELKEKIVPKDKEEKGVSDFKFEANEQSLSQWQTQVSTRLGRARTARPNVHWRIINGTAYKNVEEKSWTMDEREECIIQRDDMVKTLIRDKKPMLTRAELDQIAIEKEMEVREINAGIVRENPRWIPVKREDANDTRIEDTLLIFKDDKHTEPDWTPTIYKIKKFGNSAGYSEEHFSTCLDRLVSFFMPTLREVVADLKADEKAKYLMNRDSQDSHYHRLYDKLNNLTRLPSESIRVKLADLAALAEAMYKDLKEPEKSHNITRTMVDGMINLTVGKTKEEVLNYIEYAKSQRKTVDWQKMVKGVCDSERVHGAPTVALRYNAAVQPTQRLFNVSQAVNIKQGPTIRTVNVRNAGKYTFKKDNTLLEGQNNTQTEDWKQHFAMIVESVEALGQKLDQNLSISEDVHMKDETSTVERQGAEAEAAQEPRRSERVTIQPARFVPSHNTSLETYFAQVMQTKIDEYDKKRKEDRSRSRAKRDSYIDKKGKPSSNQNDRQLSKESSRQPSRDSSRQPSRDSSRQSSRDSSRQPSRDSSRQYGRQNTGQRTPNQRETGARRREYTKESSSDEKYKKEISPDKRSSRPDSRGNRYDRRRSEERKNSSSERTKYEKGITCSIDYDPKVNKHCAKCYTFMEHHEFACPWYLRRAANVCRRCKAGYHWSAECREEEKQTSKSRSNSRGRDKIREKLN